MIETGEIERTLCRGVDSGAVPGVVAMAADADGVVYEARSACAISRATPR
jgi:hypothetical protein